MDQSSPPWDAVSGVRVLLATTLIRHFGLDATAATQVTVLLGRALAPLEDCPVQALPPQVADERSAALLVDAHAHAIHGRRPVARSTCGSAGTAHDWVGGLFCVLAASFVMSPPVAVQVRAGLAGLVDWLFLDHWPDGAPAPVHVYRGRASR